MLSIDQVAKHNSRESCWVIIEGHVYDVTDFLDEHPGGASIILRYGGKDATEEYLPVHPKGTIEKELSPDKHLGIVNLGVKSTAAGALTLSQKASIQQSHPIELCVNLDDFEAAAHAKLSRRAWTYYASATETGHAEQLNRKDWKRVIFRPRILRNVQKVTMTWQIMGYRSSLPFFIAPVALGRLGHPDGELCLARGAAKYKIPYAVSTGSSVSLEELAGCTPKGESCLFYQLYVPKKRNDALVAINRAKNLGFRALLITVDTAVVGKREMDDKNKIETALEAGDHAGAASVSAGPNAAASSSAEYVFRGPFSSTLNWQDISWICKAWGNQETVALKGITCVEDAKLAYTAGIRTIYLSNHGGRQLDSAPSALRTLLEIRQFCPEILSNCEILVDGGVRRATDVIKAICLGARAVGLGRSFMYAMSAYGEAGVCKAIEILANELQTSMRLLGVTSLDQLGPHMINARELELRVVSSVRWSPEPTATKL